MSYPSSQDSWMQNDWWLKTSISYLMKRHPLGCFKNGMCSFKPHVIKEAKGLSSTLELLHLLQSADSPPGRDLDEATSVFVLSYI
ncbi:hypothetical protein NFI96_017132 [Prochilodus magdalenae]|nr:hypothetical protein NFI96_017132 [Prochilodus magdalenae]